MTSSRARSAHHGGRRRLHEHRENGDEMRIEKYLELTESQKQKVTVLYCSGCTGLTWGVSLDRISLVAWNRRRQAFLKKTEDL
jgi:hypothetical protein